MKTNKKGFTLVELVIVIAVIAILAAVLLPTFAGIIARANENAAYQRARSTMDEVLGAEYYESLDDMSNMIFVVTNNSGDHYAYQVQGGGLKKILDKNSPINDNAVGVTISAAGVPAAIDPVVQNDTPEVGKKTTTTYTVVNDLTYKTSYTGLTIYGVTVDVAVANMD